MSEVYLQITAGDGPKECQWVVVQLANAFCKEAKRDGLTAEIMWDDDPVPTALSLLMKVKGTGAATFATDRVGSIRWIGQSHFRKNHKRKNWFVGVSKAPEIQDVPELNERDIRYQTLKAGGPGGQHVNKTESAVRATHLPTGLSVVAREERSQFANKRLTRIKLALLLEGKKQASRSDQKDQLWTAHKGLERGNEVRIYEGTKFKLKRG